MQEKAFVAFGWIPKATVQAALGGVVLATATKSNMNDVDKATYEKYGRSFLT